MISQARLAIDEGDFSSPVGVDLLGADAMRLIVVAALKEGTRPQTCGGVSGGGVVSVGAFGAGGGGSEAV